MDEKNSKIVVYLPRQGKNLAEPKAPGSCGTVRQERCCRRQNSFRRTNKAFSAPQILYALALDATAQPDDKTYANQLKAAEILEPMFRTYPDHPGVAHYLIHTYDYAGLADKGLPSARAYAAIAPSVPHALAQSYERMRGHALYSFRYPT